MTYGEEQEAASDALLTLLNSPAPDESSAALILGLRRQIHLALHERLELMGLSRHLDQPQRSSRQLDTIRHPLHCLERILRTLRQPTSPTLRRPASSRLVPKPPKESGPARPRRAPGTRQRRARRRTP